MNANEVKEATEKLAGTLRRTRQTEWARELEDALGDGPVTNQMLGDIMWVLRRLNGTSLPGILGNSETISQIISSIDKLFKTRK